MSLLAAQRIGWLEWCWVVNGWRGRSGVLVATSVDVRQTKHFLVYRNCVSPVQRTRTGAAIDVRSMGSTRAPIRRIQFSKQIVRWAVLISHFDRTGVKSGEMHLLTWYAGDNGVHALSDCE